MKLIMALDVHHIDIADKYIGLIGNDYVDMYKFGLEFAVKFNIKDLKNKPKRVFLDLKLFDIPTTVNRAIENIDYLGYDDFLSVAKYSHKLPKTTGFKLIGISGLTSEGYSLKQILSNTEMALNNGCSGVVCGGLEAKEVKRVFDCITITPGIRMAEQNIDDHKRFCKPSESGGDYIVVGRYIRDSINPFKAITKIRKEMENNGN